MAGFDLATATPTAAANGFDFTTAKPVARIGSGPLDAIQAGYQGSATGLMIRGRLPDVVLDHSHATWYEKALSSAAGTVSEFPEMVAGGVLGRVLGSAAGSAAGPAGVAVGGLLGTGAGSFFVPAAIREAYIQALSKGDVSSTADFLTRASIVLKQASKEGLVGALTLGAGGVAGRVVGKAVAPGVGTTLVAKTAVTGIETAATAAELGTMVVAPAALEGKLPEPEDFLNAAIVLGGMKGSVYAASRLRSIWAKAGVPPEQVVADAAADPKLVEEITGVKSAPAVAPGFVRYYHGGNPEGVEGSLWFTSHLPDAEGWAGRDPSMKIWYVDVAADNPVRGGDPVFGVIPPTRIELPAEIASKRALLKPEEKVEPKAKAGEQLELPGIPEAYRGLADAETARAIVPGVKAEQVAASPFADKLPQAPGEPAVPTHVNYNRIDTPEKAKLALAQMSNIYEAEIQKQRRGTVSWEQSNAEAARIIGDLAGDPKAALDFLSRTPGTAAGNAELLARKQLLVGTAEEMLRQRDALLAKGKLATPEDHLTFVASIERAAMANATFLGARAEAGRALNILKSMERNESQVSELLATYGKDPATLAKMLVDITTPEGALKFARNAAKAGKWEQVIEAWKAGLVSGPITHAANVMGNTTFAAMRPVIDGVASVFGLFHEGERVHAAEPLARVVGSLEGLKNGLNTAIAVLRNGQEEQGKAESFRKAIPGTAGEIVRLPFRFLSAEDAAFKEITRHGELHSLAVREAAKEGLSPLTREFRERVVELAQNPTEKMTKAAEEAALRYTFNMPLGEKGQAVQKFVRSWHLEWAVPFIRTPGNIAKELARMTPLAPLVKEWREALSSGGIARDRAMAELVTGTAIMSGVMALAFNETITGNGNPDPNKRRVMAAAGWQPYSIKVGDTYYNYQRLQPIGTLMGLAADLAEVWERLDTDESDKIPKMLAVAFANAVTNQTFLQGITNIVNVGSDPTRYGAKFAQNYAGSLVPAIVAQPTQMLDPVQREVNSMLDAIKARIPGERGTLLPKIDIYGEPVGTKQRLGGFSPVTETKETDDKVRSEGARLDIAIGDVPKKIHIGHGTGKLGEVPMTPEQRNIYSKVSGEFAHRTLSDIVNAPSWDTLPDIAKKRIFKRVFEVAHKAGAAAALSPEERIPVIEKIIERMQEETDKVSKADTERRQEKATLASALESSETAREKADALLAAEQSLREKHASAAASEREARLKVEAQLLAERQMREGEQRLRNEHSASVLASGEAAQSAKEAVAALTQQLNESHGHIKTLLAKPAEPKVQPAPAQVAAAAPQPKFPRLDVIRGSDGRIKAIVPASA